MWISSLSSSPFRLCAWKTALCYYYYYYLNAKSKFSPHHTVPKPKNKIILIEKQNIKQVCIVNSIVRLKKSTLFISKQSSAETLKMQTYPSKDCNTISNTRESKGATTRRVRDFIDSLKPRKEQRRTNEPTFPLRKKRTQHSTLW